MALHTCLLTRIGVPSMSTSSSSPRCSMMSWRHSEGDEGVYMVEGVSKKTRTKNGMTRLSPANIRRSRVPVRWWRQIRFTVGAKCQVLMSLYFGSPRMALASCVHRPHASQSVPSEKSLSSMAWGCSAAWSG